MRNNCRAYFSPLFCTVSACNTPFEKKNTLFSVKTFKITCQLGWWRVPNVLNLEQLGVKINKYVLLLNFPALFFCNTAWMPPFSRISPGLLQKWGGMHFGGRGMHFGGRVILNRGWHALHALSVNWHPGLPIVVGCTQVSSCL